MAVTLNDLPKVTEVSHTIEPTWDKDSGRIANSGKFVGTFVGFFDTLEVKVGKTTSAEMVTLRSNIDVPIIENVTFVDSYTGQTSTRDFYGTSITATYTRIGGYYKPTSFKLKALERRSDM